jgi:large subunit ribosomal protein L22
MEVQAITRDVRVSARKIRLVADSIREIGSIDETLAVLSMVKKRGAYSLTKTLKSAVANAINNGKLEKENLLIEKIEVTDGQALKRFHPSTRGRVHPYKRRSSHVRIVLKTKPADAKAMADKGGEK